MNTSDPSTNKDGRETGLSGAAGSVPWITNCNDVPGASDEALMRALLTCDGGGVNVKAAALNELRERSYKQGWCDSLLNSA